MSLVPIKDKPGSYYNTETRQTFALMIVAYVEVVEATWTQDHVRLRAIAIEAERRAGPPWKAIMGDDDYTVRDTVLRADGQWAYLVAIRREAI